MPNSLLTIDMITKEALRLLHQKLVFVGNVNRQYDDQFAKTGAKIGSSLRIRLPNSYTARTSITASTQDTMEESVTLTVANIAGVDVAFTSQELTMSLDDFSSRVLEPAMATIASNIEYRCYQQAVLDTYNQVGTIGQSASFAVYLQSAARLDNCLAPRDNNRTLIIHPDQQVTIINELRGLFHDSTQIEKQYREGLMGRSIGFNWYQSTIYGPVTNGTNVTGITVSGASQTGSSLTTSSASGNVFRAGQQFTIANVFAVHPETRVTMNYLQQFVITADTTATGTSVVLPISPPIIPTGPRQNVSGSPANGANITFSGTASQVYTPMLAFHRDAYVFVTADLEIPDSVVPKAASRQTYDGISMRVIKYYDGTNDKENCRIDVLYGFRTVRPSLGCRIVY